MTRGSSYGDLSRPPADPRRYRDVRQQQGRVQLDSDWNDQVELAEHALASSIVDLVGSGAAPARSPGFHVRPVVALSFDGGGRAVAVDPARYRPATSDDLTVEAWVAWREGGAILGCAGPDGGGGYCLRVDDDGLLAFERAGLDDDGAARWFGVKAVEPIDLAHFTQVVVVCEGPTVTIHADGDVVGLGTLPAGPPAPIREGQLLLGAGVGAGGDDGFSGDLGGVRIWSAALSPEDVRRDASATLDDTEPPDLARLQAWWPLDDGTGTAARERMADDKAELMGDEPPTWRLIDLDIQPGRYYVGGVAVELDAAVRLTEQPTAPGSALPSGEGSHLLYLEAWDRTITAIQAPDLREVALGGLDTTVRSAPVASVHHVPIPPGTPNAPGDHAAALERILATTDRLTTGRMRARHHGRAPGNHLYRVEVTVGGRTGAPGTSTPVVPVLEVGASSRQLLVASDVVGGFEPGTAVVVTGLDPAGQPVEARLTLAESARRDRRGLRLRLAPAADALVVLAHCTELRLATADAPPTFSWSRSNGSVCVAVTGVHPGSTTIDIATGGADPTPLQPGDAVELLDDPAVLGHVPQPILTVISVSYETGKLVVDRPPPLGVGSDPSTHPFLRRWDQDPTAPGNVDGAVPIGPDAWIRLEDGIEVAFDAGTYRRGDFWWVTAREATAGIEWPTDGGHPASVPPAGVGRRRAVLGTVTFDGSGVVVRDLRSHFAPITSRPLDATSAPPVAPESAVRRPDERPVAFTDDPSEGPETLAPGLALVGRPDALPPGYRSTGVQVVTRDVWSSPRDLTPDPGVPQAVVGDGHRLLLVTDREVHSLDPSSGATDLVAALPEPRTGAAVLLVDDTVFLVGGVAGGRADGAVVAVDLRERSWSKRRAMPHVRTGSTVLEADGHLHCLGGRGRFLGIGFVSRRHQVYDLAADRWEEGERLPRPCYQAGGAAIVDGIHVAGGLGRWWFGRRPITDHLVLVPGPRWVRGAALPVDGWRQVHGATLDGAVAVTGSDRGVAQVLLHRPHDWAWRSVAPPGPGADPLAAPSSAGLALVLDGTVRTIAAEHRFDLVEPVPGAFA